MSGEVGFVYLAINPNMPGLVKIGRTINVEARMIILSAATGVPGAFECVFSISVENPADVERQLHRLYNYCRVERRNEFFKVDWQAVRATVWAMDIIPYTPDEVSEGEPDVEEDENPVNAEEVPINAGPLHPFLEAIRHNNQPLVQSMIDEGEDLNLRQRFNWRLLVAEHNSIRIGELLTLNPDDLMEEDYPVVKTLILGLIRQNTGQLYTSEIARRLGIDTAALDGRNSMWFCWKNLVDLEKEKRVTSEKRGRNRYWSIPLTKKV